MKLYFKLKYYYHSLQFKQLSNALKDCQDDEVRVKIQRKINDHERLALNYIMKT